MHPMVLLRDMDQVVAHFSSFGDSVNLDTRWVHGLQRMFHRLGNQVEAHFGPFGDSFNVDTR
jgi:hypothetical protein